MSNTNISIIDCKTIPQALKHPTVFKKLDLLKSGNILQLVTDHDPKTLYLELLEKIAGQFVWTYIESGPEIWKINIKKI